jgi:23S rRNA (pseudouridine1915-N3)-methyltransferase
MSFSIHIIGVGNKKEFLDQEAEHYRRLIRPYASLTITCLKPFKEKHNNARIIRENEGKRIFSKWPKQSYPVALSEEGKMFDSKSFSQWISKRVLSGSHLTLNIGGAYGLSLSVKNKCKEVISLSPLTLPHRLCYIILIEQLYRAFTILKKHPYHK